MSCSLCGTHTRLLAHHADDNIVLVSHGGPIQALLEVLTGAPHYVKICSISKLNRADAVSDLTPLRQQYVIESVSSTRHLSKPSRY